jgi:elongation factor Tu
MRAGNLNEVKTLLHVVLLGASGHGKSTLASALVARRRQLGDVPPPAPSVRPSNRVVVEPPPLALRTAARQYAFCDEHNDGDLFRAMLRRAGACEGAVLVVRPDLGPVSDSVRRQVWLAHRLRVPWLAVFLNLKDGTASADVLHEIEAQLRALLHVTGYPGDDTLFVIGDAWSAYCAAGRDDALARPLDGLLAALDAGLVPPVPQEERPFRMLIEEISSRKQGRYSVATGVVRQGRVRVGQRVELVGVPPPAGATRVLGLRQFHRAPHSVPTGCRVDVLLRRDLRGALEPGMFLARPRSLGRVGAFDAVVCGDGARACSLLTFGRVSFDKIEAPGAFAWPGGRSSLSDGECLPVRVELKEGRTLPVYPGRTFTLFCGGSPTGVPGAVTVR